MFGLSMPTTDGQDVTTTASDATPETAVPPVEVSDVSFGYTGTPVVEDITLSVSPGEFVALVGPNGSGKSTLLGLVLGLHRPDSGTVSLFGEPAHRFDDGTRLGYVAQQTDAAVSMPITVREVVQMGRFSTVGFGRLSAADWRAVDEAIETVGMRAFADRPIAQLSGGQRQRAFIARALAGDAELLVLDEPTVGVDAESVEAFYELLETLNDEGLTILLVEHDIGSVTDHAGRVVCLNREVYFDGPTEAFLDSDALGRAFGATQPAGGD